jgi:hypothetical protein
MAKPLFSDLCISYTSHLKYGSTNIHAAIGVDAKTAEDNTFFQIAQMLQVHDPVMWEKFKKGEPAAPQILFKVELSNCEQIDPQIRQKLARHF